MIVDMYCYRDRKLGVYGYPFKSTEIRDNTVEQISRTVKLGKFPDAKDYELYFVGSFDDHTCIFNILEKPEFVCDLAEYLPVKKEEA